MSTRRVLVRGLLTLLLFVGTLALFGTALIGFAIFVDMHVWAQTAMTLILVGGGLAMLAIGFYGCWKDVGAWLDRRKVGRAAGNGGAP